jgi:hypothetical protein
VAVVLLFIHPFLEVQLPMFDRLFKFPAIRVRHSSGPLVQERLAYLTHLADQGMRDASLLGVASYLLVVACYLRLAGRAGEAITLNEIERAAARWARRRSAPNHRPGRKSLATFRLRAIGWLEFLGRYKPPDPPIDNYAGLMTAFADYMRHDRGFSAGLIHMRCWSVRRFLDRLVSRRESGPLRRRAQQSVVIGAIVRPR